MTDKKEQSTSLIASDYNENQVGIVKPKQDGCVNPWTWFRAKPFDRYPFLVFLVFAALNIIWLLVFFIGEYNLVPCAVAACIMSVYGAYMFRTLLALKAEVDQFHKNNTELKVTNEQLAGDVSNLRRANRELESTVHSIEVQKKKSAQLVEQFKTLEEHLSKMGQSNIQGLERLRQASKNVKDSIISELISNEKQMLATVFLHLRKKYGSARELNEEQVQELWESLPPEYLDRFQSMGKTFTDIAGDDGLMDVKEFMQLMDVLIDQQVQAKYNS